MPNSISANSIIGRKIYPPDFFHKRTDCYWFFVRINAFHANIDVNDKLTIVMVFT
jgi:hypothetical protein